MDLQSLGHAAATFQRDPRVISAGLLAVQADEAFAAGQPIPHEVRPALRLNGVPYFEADQIVAAIGWLAESDARQAAATAAQETASDE
jgi:hypothetical protein